MSTPETSADHPSSSEHREDFTATHWTQVARAADQDGSRAARQALEALCTRYWPPIYGFLRRKNYSPEEAADLVQGFFAQLLEENAFARADRARGRFRNFLLGALQRHLADVQRRNSAQKRGRGRIDASVDVHALESSFRAEAVDPGLTPDELYDRSWAATVLDAAFTDLQEEFREAGQAARFEVLKRFLSDDAGEGDYAAVAATLGISAKAVSSAVSRLRERYRALVRRNVRATVSAGEELDAELQVLFR